MLSAECVDTPPFVFVSRRFSSATAERARSWDVAIQGKPSFSTLEGNPASRTFTNDLSDLIRQIKCMGTLSGPPQREGWPLPSAEVIEHAIRWIGEFRDAVAKTGGLQWARPHLASSPEGHVVFEWWKGARDVAVYIEPQAVFHVRSWGDDFDEDMSDGYLEPEGLHELAAWLLR